MIYASAGLKTVATFENQKGAFVDFVRVELTEASEQQILDLARARKDELLAKASPDHWDWARDFDRNEDDLLVALLVEPTLNHWPPFTADYEHSAYCNGCRATIGDEPQRLANHRRAQMADRQHLILTDASVARDWAAEHAAICTALPQ